MRDRITGLSRRAVLRGLGVAVALPWLESLPGGEPAPAAGPARPPRRFVCLYMANGVAMKGWRASAQGGALALSQTLAPLAPLRDRVALIDGLRNESAKNSHAAAMNVLAGVAPLRSISEVRLGTTVDQLMAQHLGARTAIPSLVLGTEPNGLGEAHGYSATYRCNVSWSSPTAPVPKDILPQLAFDRLFVSDARRRQDRSVLDLVRAQAADLRGALDAVDRRRVDEYLDSVRDIERRIEQAGRPRADGGWRPASEEPGMQRPESVAPERVEEHHRLMLDLIVAALRADRTRIATFMFQNETSNMNFGFLDGVRGSHHENSHVGGEPYRRINEYHVRMAAGFLGRLAQVDEGGTSLLDSTSVLFLSCIGEGNGHTTDNLPILLAGGGHRGGRYLDLREAPAERRRLCNLHLTLLRWMGVPADRFADSSGALDLA